MREVAYSCFRRTQACHSESHAQNRRFKASRSDLVLHSTQFEAIDFQKIRDFPETRAHNIPKKKKNRGGPKSAPPQIHIKKSKSGAGSRQIYVTHPIRGIRRQLDDSEYQLSTPTQFSAHGDGFHPVSYTHLTLPTKA